MEGSGVGGSTGSAGCSEPYTIGNPGMTGKVSENDQRLERAEVEHLLSSGMFQRAPLLARLLTYICEKTLSGQADEVKEYNIAVEALGRPADFDQRRDAIVRVEAHRLRKRLDAY